MKQWHDAAQPFPPVELILGSSSPYRRDLLARLRLPFRCISPDVDETPRADESPQSLACRLAGQKAQAALAMRQAVNSTPAPHDADAADVIVIGCDQVCALDGVPLSKPGTLDRAIVQLELLSGRSVDFHTALCVLRPRIQFCEGDCITVRTRFRRLTRRDIERYLALEPALDCAGSAKSEGLGIALLERIESDDPTALIGLPLIRTADLLRRCGLDPLRQPC